MKSFNAELKQRLTEAGYSQQEMEFGAVTAQAKVAFAMLERHARQQPELMVTWIMLTQTVARVLATASDSLNLDAERITAASDIIGDAARGMARQLAERDQSPTGLDATPPAGPMDVN
jgi:hypothetical protein